MNRTQLALVAMIAAALVYVVARWAPFSKVNKTLFAFGYFPFFEYAVIARSYGLLFLLLMIACVLISRQRVLLQGNVRRADRKQKVDAMAAAILLQSYLDNAP